MKPAEETPTIETRHAKIWDIPPRDDRPAQVAAWIVYAPWAHPLWNYHFAALAHLRDVDGMEPAKIHLPDATHEFAIFALSPDHDVDTDKLSILHPVSIAQQFIAKNDAEAREVIEQCLHAVADGKISPDSDFRGAWQDVLVNYRRKK